MRWKTPETCCSRIPEQPGGPRAIQTYQSRVPAKGIRLSLFLLFPLQICYNDKENTYVRFLRQPDQGMKLGLARTSSARFGGYKVRILGIDPGIAIVGFGFIDKQGSKLVPVQYGCIQTEAGTEPSLRLQQVYDAAVQLIDKYKPDAVAIEKLFFNRNVTTALTVGEARGVLLLAAVQKGLPVAEYTPLQVKQAVVGYGKAEKKQVQEMVKLFLKLSAVPKPDDVADALAIAICHAHSSTLQQKLNGVPRR